MKKLKVVVTGYIGLLPYGGVTWDYIQYPLGFKELGCEVLYLEDTMQWPGSEDGTCRGNVAYLDSVMSYFGLERQWAYRDVISSKLFGVSELALQEFCRRADVLVNVSCCTPLRTEYAAIPVRALIDSDPMFTQMQYVTHRSLNGLRSQLPEIIPNHTHLFTYGENVGQQDCGIPLAGLCWTSTRQPVVLKHWPVSDLPQTASYTTVMNWAAANKVDFGGRWWGQKDLEFAKFMSLPQLLPSLSFALAVSQSIGPALPASNVTSLGWQVLKASQTATNPRSYRKFIQGSRGEFSVAKQTYVQANTGWFSGRSACYLATGRPVVTQETGWSKYIPAGTGLFSFSDLPQAIAALETIERDPQMHAQAARAIAEEVFDSAKVLRELLSEVGLQA